MPTDTSSNPSPREIARMEARYALVLSGDA